MSRWWRSISELKMKGWPLNEDDGDCEGGGHGCEIDGCDGGG